MDRQNFEKLMEAGAFDQKEITPEWEAPVPFDEMELPDFPLDVLPGTLFDFVEALAESTQTPPEMAGLLSLGVLATAFQSKFTVEVRPDWREPLSLFVVAVAPPGERKSAVFSALTDPIYDYEAELRDSEAVAIQQQRAERRMLEKMLAAAENAAAKGKCNREKARDEVMALSADLATLEEKHPFRLLVDDVTPERLIDLMAEQNGCMTVASAEGGLFDCLRGRYDRVSNFDVYLKGHAGDAITVDRVGRTGNSIRHPHLTLMLAVQPDVLHGLMDNATLRGRGLCGRFLYAVCRSKVGHRKVSPEPIPGDVRTRYRDFVVGLLTSEYRGVIRLSPEADKVRMSFQQGVEVKLGGAWETMRDWAGKLVGATVRIAALIHAAEAIHAGGNPADFSIDGDTMTRAVKIADVLAAHAEAAYWSMGANEDLEAAKYLWRRIYNAGQDEITKRDLFRLVRGKFKKSEDIEEPLHVLEDRGYIRIEVPMREGAGRKASPLIRINPLSYREAQAGKSRPQ